MLSLVPDIVAQIEDNDIIINWLDMNPTVKDKRITLKWGIKAKKQIIDISIFHNGVALKGLNAVENDGYDMKKSQLLILEKGENKVEIVVSTVKGKKRSSKKITLVDNIDNDNLYDYGDYACLDSLIYAAYGGDMKAQYLMAKFYLNGTNGLGKDLFESSLWFKKSAEKTYAPSQYEFSIALLEGRGILKNVPLGIHWLIQSATNNYAEAQLKLGLCYELGEGVEINIERAKEWYRKCPLSEAKQRLMVLDKL